MDQSNILNRPKPLVLIVLDGWGEGPKGKANAIDLAHKPFWDSLIRSYPHTVLDASGEAVGIPAGMAGNSEVGHMNLGAGFPVLQDVMRISKSIETGEFFTNTALVELAKHVNTHKSTLHIIGLLGKAVVHSRYEHLIACIKFAKQQGVKDCVVHVITDGRDSSPNAGIDNIAELQRFLDAQKYGRIGSIIGRYYAMDRDLRWERTQLAYDLLTLGQGIIEENPVDALGNAYKRGETDEFIKPILMRSKHLVNTVKDDDGVLWFNFRTDRPRQLDYSFNKEKFEGFVRLKKLNNLHYVTMTRYEKDLQVSGVCFDPPDVENPISKLIADAGLHQVHIAESEKKAHVTYFFNGGRELPFENEDRIILPSPHVATYDFQPEMDALGISDAILESINSGKYDFILANYANPDMVGHTGNMAATIKAIEFVDSQIERITKAILNVGGALIITADHGNAEQLINPTTGGIDTEHNIYPVPFIYVGHGVGASLLPQGILSDVATTIAKLLDLKLAPEMTGNDLLATLRE